MKKILYILVLITFMLCIDKINAYTEYKIGDVVPYNGMNFYVIKESSSEEDSVTMLKAEPLTVEEVNKYGGVGTENNHVNVNVSSDTSSSYYQKAYNQNGYGGLAYYSSPKCYNYSLANNTGYHVNCTNNYNNSDVKYVVDAWTRDVFLTNNYKTARLPIDDEIADLGFELYNNGSLTTFRKTENTPEWAYSNKYQYWVVSSGYIINYYECFINYDGDFYYGGYIYTWNVTVRPVVEIYKVALGDEEESIVDNNTKTDDKQENDDQIENESELKKSEKNTSLNNSKTTVKVANTYMSSSIIIIILGFITASVSVLIIYKFSNKKR